MPKKHKGSKKTSKPLVQGGDMKVLFALAKRVKLEQSYEPQAVLQGYEHATLFASDVPPSKVIKILDRFLMYYIRTADKLMRTSRWLEGMEGGIEVCV